MLIKQSVKMSKKYILFDLDGTITDSSEGITKSVKFALEKIGIKEESQAALRRFIGPPLDESFERFYGLSKEDALKAVSLYRERYNDIGIFENYLFDGVTDCLKELKENGFVVALATCKPEIYVPRIFKHFDIEKYFDIAVGSELEGGKRRHKNDVIDEVLRQICVKYGIDESDINEVKADAIMVGDRKDDILGAKLSGIESVGVRYGFAEENELEDAGADYIVDELKDLKEIIY